MNNLRLLAGLLCAGLSSGGVYAAGSEPTVMTLEQIFEFAETNSVHLRPAFTAEKESRQAVSEARAAWLPDIHADLSVSYIGDGFTVRRDFSDYSRAPIPHFGNGLSLSLTQPIFTGGAISRSIELAEIKSTAARYTADFERNDIRFRLTGYYLDLYKCVNLRTVVLHNITQAKKILAEMTARYEQGIALHNDITRYELLVSNFELQLIKLDNMLDILNHDLVTTAGLPDETIVRPDTTMLDRVLPIDGEPWWQQQASTYAPALKLADTRVALSRKTEELVKADRLPKIGFKAGWTIDGPILVEVPPINRNLSYWYVGIGLNYNLSSLYKNDKSLRRSKTAVIKAAEELTAARENVEMAVRADYIHYLEAYEELKTQLKSVELAESNYATTATRYSTDMALITDMLDAVSAKVDAEQRLVNARINIIYYYYKLLFTSGKI